MTTITGRATRRWIAGVVLVSAGWLASPGAIPIYDGVDFPDEPYQFAGKQPAAVTAAATVPVTQGSSAALQLKSPEQGPQVLLDLASGALTGPGGSITLTATPLAGTVAPPRGQLDGNVYRITAGPGGAVRPEAAQGFLFLRAAEMTRPDPIIVYRTTAAEAWRELPTTRAGTDILSTPFRLLGDYSVVRLPGSEPLGAGGISLVRVLLLGGGVLLLIVVTVLVLRRSGTEPDEPITAS